MYLEFVSRTDFNTIQRAHVSRFVTKCTISILARARGAVFLSIFRAHVSLWNLIGNIAIYSIGRSHDNDMISVQVQPPLKKHSRQCANVCFMMNSSPSLSANVLLYTLEYVLGGMVDRTRVTSKPSTIACTSTQQTDPLGPLDGRNKVRTLARRLLTHSHATRLAFYELLRSSLGYYAGRRAMGANRISTPQRFGMSVGAENSQVPPEECTPPSRTHRNSASQLNRRCRFRPVFLPTHERFFSRGFL